MNTTNTTSSTSTTTSGASSGFSGADEEVGRRRPDPRLPAYLVAGFGALIVAIATGQPELAALGAPFVALAAIGLMDRDPVRIRGHLKLHRDRAVEDDVIEGEAYVDWDGEAEVDVMLADGHGVTPEDPAPVVGWSLPAGRGPVTLPFRFRARSWGVHEIGALWVRVRRPGSFVVNEYRLALSPTVRVLPTPLRLSRLLKPGEPRAIAGVHLARFRGHGTDFAELRPYRPGDRLRDLSWGTSARLGVPWVRVNHPERTATVVLVLDTVFSDGEGQREALARAARATWAVASMHLRVQDRVGLLARGRTAVWLSPRGGRRARWMVLDELLTIGGAAEDPSRRRSLRRRVAVPSDALVVGVTSLRSQTFVPHLLHYRHTGHATVALVIDTSDLLPEAGSPTDVAVHRIWLAQREAQRHSLERGGVPTALVTATDGVGAAILTLHRRMNALQRPIRVGITAP
ncbi:MAG: DUF58 domain-containing protein [Gemmatimonadota bacterium]